MEKNMEEKPVTNLFKRIVSAVTLVCFTITGVIAPTIANAGTTVTIAPASGVTSTWANYSAQPNNWVSMPNAKGYGTNVSWPKLNYTTIATSQWVPIVLTSIKKPSTGR